MLSFSHSIARSFILILACKQWQGREKSTEPDPSAPCFCQGRIFLAMLQTSGKRSRCRRCFPVTEPYPSTPQVWGEGGDAAGPAWLPGRRQPCQLQMLVELILGGCTQVLQSGVLIQICRWKHFNRIMRRGTCKKKTKPVLLYALLRVLPRCPSHSCAQPQSELRGKRWPV